MIDSLPKRSTVVILALVVPFILVSTLLIGVWKDLESRVDVIERAFIRLENKDDTIAKDIVEIKIQQKQIKDDQREIRNKQVTIEQIRFVIKEALGKD